MEKPQYGKVRGPSTQGLQTQEEGKERTHKKGASDRMTDIIEVDQWTASGNIETLDFDSVSLQTINGGDSQAAKSIFGGSFQRKQVSENDHPSIGSVWYIKGDNGKCKLWKYHFDTSD